MAPLGKKKLTADEKAAHQAEREERRRQELRDVRDRERSREPVLAAIEQEVLTNAPRRDSVYVEIQKHVRGVVDDKVVIHHRLLLHTLHLDDTMIAFIQRTVAENGGKFSILRCRSKGDFSVQFMTEQDDEDDLYWDDDF